MKPRQKGKSDGKTQSVMWNRKHAGISHQNNAHLMKNYLGHLNVLTLWIECKKFVLPERETYKHIESTDNLTLG